jgi:hypothetical protein
MHVASSTGANGLGCGYITASRDLYKPSAIGRYRCLNFAENPGTQRFSGWAERLVVGIAARVVLLRGSGAAAATVEMRRFTGCDYRARMAQNEGRPEAALVPLTVRRQR